MRLPQPQRPQRGGIGFAALGVDLVGRQKHRLAGPLQNPRRRLIARRCAHHRIDDEDDRVGGAHRHRCLLGDQLLQALGVGLPAAGVLNEEPPTSPVRVVGDAVAGDAGNVLHHRFATAEDAVHQSGLADVRPTDDSDNRRCGGFACLIAFLARVGFDEFPIAFVGPGAVGIGHRDAPARCWTSSTRRAITSDSDMSLVSTTSASSAARSGDTARVESRWSRRFTSASTAS